MKILFTLLLGLLGVSGLAQTGIAAKELAPCDAAMQQFMSRWKVLGASVALAKDGRLVYERAFGYADVARTVPMQPYHLLRVASISKTVTALAIMKLAEDGQLSLTHQVFGPGGYLPGPAYTQEIRDARLYDITVQQLLEHTAGWDRGVGCDGYGSCDPIDFPTHVAQVMGVANPVGDSTIIRYMLRQGLSSAPGARFAYSNVGYLVLGKVLEAVTRQPYEAWVRQHVLQPSGVLEAHLGRNLPAARQERESDYQSRYRMLSCYNPGQQVPAAYGGYQLEAMNAHGGWLFSARDLVRLVLAADGTGARPALLSAATLGSMMRPSARAANYAKGWMVNDSSCWHTGQLDGTASLVTRAAGGYVWAILLNTSNGSPEFWRDLQALGWGWRAKARGWPAHNLFAPEQNATSLRVSAPDAAHRRLSWTNGSGTHRLVLLQADHPSTAFPLDGQAYPAASSLPDGTFIVANGGASTALLPPLPPQRTYYARVVEYRQDATTGHQPVYTLDGNAGLALAPAPLDQPLLASLTGAEAGGRRGVGRLGRWLGRGARARRAAPAKDIFAAERPLAAQQPAPETYLLRVRRAVRESVLHFVRQ